jgi:hypothetical protein
MTYIDEELRLLAGLPQLIGAAVASASGSGAIGTGKEFIAGATSLLEGLRSYPDNSIIRQILPNPAADRSKALEWAKASREWVTQQVSTDGRPSRENLATATLQAAEAASRLLNAKASPRESREYREWTLSVAERVANASSEGGFLGFGGERVTTEEKQFIDQLRSTLNLTKDLAPANKGKIAHEDALKTDASFAKRPLTGRKVIVTAGPTHEPLGAGAFIASASKGLEGYALAEAAVALGAETILVSGPVSLPMPQGAQLMMADTADDMLRVCERELPCDIAVHAAEVAAWCLDEASKNELSATGAGEKAAVSLTRTPDILGAIGRRTDRRPSLVIGIMASTDDSGSAEARLKQTQCDLIVARDQTRSRNLISSDRLTVQLVAREGATSWSNLTTQELARRLMEELAAKLASATQ